MHVLINAINDNAFVRGPDRYLLSLLSGLNAAEFNDEYTIIHAPWQKAFAEQPLDTRFTRLCVEVPRDRWRRTVWQAIRFRTLANKLDPDIVFLPNIIWVPGLKNPTVMTVHDLAHFRFPEKFGPIRGRLQRSLIKLALRSAEQVIGVSNFTRDDIARFTHYPADHVSVIGEGAPEPKPAKRRSEWPKYFLYVGQIERSKNIEGLIDNFVVSDLFKKQDVELWITGKPGNAQSIVQQRLDANGDAGIKLLGYVSENELSELYANCLAFTFPSLVEGFGLVLLEAMAYGAPVIAMNATAVPEVVGPAGILVDPAHPDGLRLAMEAIVNNPDLRQSLREASLSRVVEFSWAKAASQTRALFCR